MAIDAWPKWTRAMRWPPFPPISSVPDKASFSMDPDYDTPKILRDYAAFHHADSKIWTFATGDAKDIESFTRAFSVYRQNEGGTISHGLASALINRDGTIERIWRGNAWTPAKVIAAIQGEIR